MTDVEIRRDVEAELAYEPSLNHAAINVSVSEGTAILTGKVNSYLEYLVAKRAALRVQGVRAVVNELDVYVPREQFQTDEELASRATKALRWTLQVPSESIKLTVEDGIITLFGEVEWPHEKKAAERTLQALIGVRRICNEIRVKEKRHEDGAKEHLLAALRRSAVSHASDIQVETHGDQVTIRGTVPTWSDRDEVVRIAWSAPGVRHVDSLVRVTPPSRHRVRQVIPAA